VDFSLKTFPSSLEVCLAWDPKSVEYSEMPVTCLLKCLSTVVGGLYLALSPVFLAEVKTVLGRSTVFISLYE